MTDLEVSHRLSLGFLWVTKAFASKEGKGLNQISEVVEVFLKLSGIYLHWGRGREEEGREEGRVECEGGGRKGGKRREDRVESKRLKSVKEGGRGDEDSVPSCCCSQHPHIPSVCYTRHQWHSSTCSTNQSVSSS